MSNLREDCINEKAKSFDDFVFDYFNNADACLVAELVKMWHKKQAKEKLSVIKPTTQDELINETKGGSNEI